MKQFNFNTFPKNPAKFSRYTGLSLREFFALGNQIEPLWKEFKKKRLSRPDRQRFQIIAGIINFRLHNKENLIPLAIPIFAKKIIFSKA